MKQRRPLLALVLLAGMSAAQDETALADLDDLQLVERLPPFQEEYVPSGLDDGFALHPAVFELRRRLDEGGVLSDAAWARAVQRAELVRARARWPVGEAFALGLRETHWLWSTLLELVPAGRDWSVARVGSLSARFDGLPFRTSREREAALYQPLGFLAPGPQVLTFDVLLLHGDDPDRYVQLLDGEMFPVRAPRVLWQGRLSFTVEGVPTVAEALPAYDEPHATEALRAALSVEAVRCWTGRAYHFDLRLNLDREGLCAAPALGVAYPLVLELLCGAESLCTKSFLLPSTDRRWFQLPDDLLTTLPFDPREDRVAAAAYHLRVRDEVPLQGPEARALLGDWDSVVRWSGEFDVPLLEVLGR